METSKGGDGHLPIGVDDRTVRIVCLSGVCDPYQVSLKLGDPGKSSRASSESASASSSGVPWRMASASSEV